MPQLLHPPIGTFLYYVLSTNHATRTKSKSWNNILIKQKNKIYFYFQNGIKYNIYAKYYKFVDICISLT